MSEHEPYDHAPMTPEQERAYERETRDTLHPAARPFQWLGREKVKRNFIWIPLVGMILSTIFGVLHPSKYPAPWEKFGDFVVPGSWAIFGFLAYSTIVFAAPVLFRLLGRAEGFYLGEELPDPDYSTDPGFIAGGGETLVGQNADDLQPGQGGSAL